MSKLPAAVIALVGGCSFTATSLGGGSGSGSADDGPPGVDAAHVDGRIVAIDAAPDAPPDSPPPPPPPHIDRIQGVTANAAAQAGARRAGGGAATARRRAGAPGPPGAPGFLSGVFVTWDSNEDLS